LPSGYRAPLAYKWVALTVTLIGTLMAGIDDRVLVIGLPTLAKQIGANITEVIWISQAYTVAATIGLLLVGRIADVVGRVKIYNAGFAIFTLGSLFASISPSPSILIVSRIVQGFGGCALTASSLAIVIDAAPPEQLGTFIGINQIAFRAGAILGLTLTGLILAVSDWRALFYINIPVGIFGTIWSRYKLKEISSKDPQRKMDWLGLATFTGGLTLVLVGITYAGYGASDTFSAIILFLIGSVSIIGFVIIETKVEVPLLDLKLLKIKSFAGGSVAAMLSTLAWNGMLYMVSLYLQVILSFSPLQAGLSILPMEIAFLLVGPLSGRMSDRFNSRILPTAGLIIACFSFLYMSTFAISTTYFTLVSALVFLSIGQGLFSSPNTRATMASVPSNRRGVASGFRGTLFNIGDSAGPVITITLITIGIPYNLFTSLIQGATPIAIELAKLEFLDGFKIAALALAAISAISIIPSMLGNQKVIATTVPDTV
jgi:EmrB/QacA subfamily drug resistance transporter